MLMKPGPATLAEATSSSFDSSIGLGGLREHHRGVGREIAVAGVARRLDRDVLAVETRRQRARRGQRVERRIDMRGETGVERHGSPGTSRKRAL
jgi:hypothetical protein